ncbi:MAG: adenylosuccinate synthetase, partial [Sphingomonas sp.]
MATQAYGVIGACYGDEGKGRTVDAIAHRLGAGTVVVRSNGGAQAGHTVVAPSGARHVFHQLGSGAFAGAATHFSRFMVSHPMMLGEEVRAVAALGGAIAITADPRGYVTTPWDMMVNQAIEMARGGARHGSCGLGFGETVLRCEES